MKKYIIGIDGGGTKTLGILFDNAGKEVKRHVCDFSHFSVNEEKSIEHITNTIDALIKNISTENISFIQIGIAGYSNYKNKAIFEEYLKKRYLLKFNIVTDAEVALYSIKRNSGKDVIMVLGGTGSVVMVEDKTGIRYIGGFGHLLGDEGSSYHLVITAFKKIIEQHEEGEEISDLSTNILNFIGAKSHLEIKEFVYNNRKAEVAKLSNLITKYALENNQEAIDLLIEEGKLLAKQTLKAYRSLKSNVEVLIGLKGGFLLNAPYVKETLIMELELHEIKYKIDISQLEPVYGAFYLAKKHLKDEVT